MKWVYIDTQKFQESEKIWCGIFENFQNPLTNRDFPLVDVQIWMVRCWFWVKDDRGTRFWHLTLSKGLGTNRYERVPRVTAEISGFPLSFSRERGQKSRRSGGLIFGIVVLYGYLEFYVLEWLFDKMGCRQWVWIDKMTQIWS